MCYNLTIMTVFYILISVLFVSLLSLLGVFWLSFKKETLEKTIFFLVSFSAGALLGDAFFHLIPQVAKNDGFSVKTGAFILGGVFIFLLLEKIVCWRHCHVPTSGAHIHPVGINNLIGDSLHNAIDGMIIAASFLVSVPLGITTFLAVVLHEIPQEIGNFGILVHAGFSRKRALFLNFVTALFALLGALIVIIFGFGSGLFITFILALTIGGFIYVACADLIPEIHKECRPKHSLAQLVAFLGGIAIMAILLLFE